MAFLIGGANSAADTGYDIANSCRFNRPDKPRLRIANPTAGVREKGTFSTWFKKVSGGTAQYLFSTWNNATNGYSSSVIYFPSADDRLNVSNYVASGASGHSTLITERVFRDPSAWYHLVVAWDTTDSTAADRYKIYVNGTRETVFNGTPSYPTEDQELFFQVGGTANPQHIGYQSTGSDTHYFDGYLAETVYIEGNALTASSFGEFDDDSPTIWKPKDVSGLTFGDEGFYLDYEDSGDLGDDESGNTNDFTETNLAATDQSVDSPTNNFAIWNSAIPTNSTMVLTEGGLNGLTGSNYQSSVSNNFFSTIGVSKGKWFAEFKYVSSSQDEGSFIGIAYDINRHQRGNADDSSANFCQERDEGWGYTPVGEVHNNGSTSGYTAHAPGDILGVAMDLDNNTVNFYKDGSSAGDAVSIDADKEYFFALSDGTSTNTFLYSANFGSPAYTESGGNSDANDYGNFSMAVPSGYFALCTKNLAEYG